MTAKVAFSKIISFSFFLFATAVPNLPASVQAADLDLTTESSARVSFIPRGDSPAPQTTQSGASRRPLPGSCGGLPVLPEGGLGLTTSSSPSLFVYFSENTMVDKARLILKSLDEEESEYYESVVTLPKEALSKGGGIVAFKLPQSNAGLALNQEYAWSLVLMCQGSLRPDSPTLKGYLKRVSDAGTQTESASLVETAIAYGNAGIWHDLVSTLATMRLENPGDATFEQYWLNVMASAGLEAIANEPLIAQ